jgi:hypothetical protein
MNLLKMKNSLFVFNSKIMNKENQPIKMNKLQTARRDRDIRIP